MIGFSASASASDAAAKSAAFAACSVLRDGYSGGGAAHCVDAPVDAATGMAATAADATVLDPRTDVKDVDEWPPLWPDNEMPEEFAGLSAQMKDRMLAEPDKWGFWQRWYEAVLLGEPLPWELSQRITAKMTEKEWDAGADVVARQIDVIRAAFLADDSHSG